MAVGTPKGFPEKPVELPIASVLWRRRSVIGWSLLGAFLLGCIYLVAAPRKYTSTAEVYIVEGQGRVMGQSPSDETRSDDYLNTQCELMTSTPVLALALAEDGIKDLDTIQDQNDPIEYLQQQINAETGKHNDLIYVSLEAHNKGDAAKIVNAVVHAYIVYQTKIQHSTSADILDLLQKEKTRDEDAIAAKNQQLAVLRNTYGETAYDGAQNNPIIQQEESLSNALTAARLDAVSAKSQYDQALAMVGNNSDMLRQIEAPDNPADLVAASPDQLLQIKTEIIQYEQAVVDMERTYLPDHPRVKTAQARLDELTVIYVRAERQRWLSAQAQEKALEASFEEQHKRVLDQATRSSDFDRLHEDLTRIEKDLDAVEGRISEVSANQDAGSLNIEITQPAVPGIYPSHPQKLHALAGWLFVGLLVGCGAALGLEKFPLGPKPMGQLSSELGLPVVGVLPTMDGLLTQSQRALQAHLEPTGAVAETVRAVARVIAQSGLDDVGGRTLLVASMNAQEGRTTLATNLAIAMAQSGLRVLIIDANNRNSQLHQIFNTSNDFGFFDLLEGRSTNHRPTQATHIENVEVLPAGAHSGNAVELLNSELLVDVLGEFSDKYDRVIVDSPALSRGVEARILAANCAAALLVSAARPTARRQIGFGLSMLRSVGGNVLGLVINEPAAIDPRQSVRLATARVSGRIGSDTARAYRNVLAAGTED